MICANQAPDHATIARFRVRHQDALAELFGQVLGLYRAARRRALTRGGHERTAAARLLACRRGQVRR